MEKEHIERAKEIARKDGFISPEEMERILQMGEPDPMMIYTQPYYVRKSVALEKVKEDGENLKHVSWILRGDRDVVLAAITQDASAIVHARKKLTKDKDFMIEAAKLNRDVLNFVSVEAREEVLRELGEEGKEGLGEEGKEGLGSVEDKIAEFYKGFDMPVRESIDNMSIEELEDYSQSLDSQIEQNDRELNKTKEEVRQKLIVEVKEKNKIIREQTYRLEDVEKKIMGPAYIIKTEWKDIKADFYIGFQIIDEYKIEGMSLEALEKYSQKADSQIDKNNRRLEECRKSLIQKIEKKREHMKSQETEIERLSQQSKEKTKVPTDPRD